MHFLPLFLKTLLNEYSLPGIVMLLRQLHKMAQKEGGAVHMLNGNHESLNVCGDYRLVSFIHASMPFLHHCQFAVFNGDPNFPVLPGMSLLALLLRQLWQLASRMNRLKFGKTNFGPGSVCTPQVFELSAPSTYRANLRSIFLVGLVMGLPHC